MAKAVILLSGGLDSATTLAAAQKEGFSCYCLSFDYGQKHRAELAAAECLAKRMGAQEHRFFSLGLGQFGGSALTDNNIAVPTRGIKPGIPVTYVPARNTVLLSLALAWAEVLEARDIFLGINAVDYSGYPDCRPEFLAAFETLSNLATKAGVEGKAMRIHAPLLHLSKEQIIQLGTRLGVDYSQTVSCYQADENGHACGICDACRLRHEGFIKAGLPDPTRYSSSSGCSIGQ